MTRMEQMEKNQQELREILARDREEHQEQMAKVMQVIMRSSREKGAVDEAGSVSTITGVQGVIEGPTYPSTSSVMPKVGIPHCQSHH